jgi:hypothetical protein
VTTWQQGGALWVHHTEGSEPGPKASPAAERAIMREIQAFHQGPQRGWSDIGYAYLVFPSGRIYEGRGWGVVGAHCPGHNSEPSCAMVGSFDDHLPTTAALDSLDYVANTVRAKRYEGHRDGYSTSCPGDALYKWINTHKPTGGSTDAPKPAPKKTLFQRLRAAGFGTKSAKAVIAKLKGSK